jgi:YHS domain-containing protein
MNLKVRYAVIAAAVLLLTGVVQTLAGEFFEKDSVAIRGYDPVAYFTDIRPVKGSAEFHAEYQGSTFHFASATHRDAFLENPTKFAPQYGGYCAFGMAKGYKAAIDQTAFTLVDDKLYLNYSETVRSRWTLNIPGYIRQADANWPDVKKLTKVHE